MAILTVYQKGKSSGINEVVVKTKEKEIENVQTAQKVEREIAASQPDANRDKLRDKWTVG